MNRRLFSLTAAAAAALLSLAVPAAIAQTKWDLPAGYPATNFHTVNLVDFANDIDKATGGKLKITVHANGALFKAPEIKRAVQGGRFCQVPRHKDFAAQAKAFDLRFKVRPRSAFANDHQARFGLMRGHAGKRLQQTSEALAAHQPANGAQHRRIARRQAQPRTRLLTREHRRPKGVRIEGTAQHLHRPL